MFPLYFFFLSAISKRDITLLSFEQCTATVWYHWTKKIWKTRQCKVGQPLMMQQKEACRKHPCVLPKKVAFLVWVPNSALIGWWVLHACFLHASCVLPACFLLYCLYMLQYTRITISKLNWTETHTILPTFLGSTQEAHMGASCVLPSVASLTGHSVCKYYIYKFRLENY